MHAMFDYNGHTCFLGGVEVSHKPKQLVQQRINSRADCTGEGLWTHAGMDDLTAINANEVMEQHVPLDYVVWWCQRVFDKLLLSHVLFCCLRGSNRSFLKSK